MSLHRPTPADWADWSECCAERGFPEPGDLGPLECPCCGRLHDGPCSPGSHCTCLHHRQIEVLDDDQ